MKIFITGSAGFIGSNLIRKLIGTNYEVYALINKNQPNLDDIKKKINWVTGNLCDKSTYVGLPNFDIIIHLAASGVKSKIRDWDSSIDSNIIGNQYLFDFVKSSKNSTTIIYPQTFYEKFLKKYKGLYSNPYIVTKYISTRMWINFFQTNENVSLVIPCIHQVYGPNDAKNNVINYIIRNLAENEKPKIGSGKQIRDWIYIEDCTNYLFELVKKQYSPKKIEYYDVGTGISYSLSEVAQKICYLMNLPLKGIVFDKNLDRDDIDFSSVAKNILPNWRPRYSLFEGLQDMRDKIII